MKREDSLRTVKGIGEKTERLFLKLNISNIGGMLEYYPRDYDTYQPPTGLDMLLENTICAVEGVIRRSPEVKGYRNKTVITVLLQEENASLQLIWFNMPFLRSTLKKGAVYVFRGNVIKKGSRMEMSQPEIFTPAAYEEMLHHMQPIYPVTAGLSNKTVVKTVASILDDIDLEPEYLPEEFRRRYELAEYNFAVRQIHFPDSMEKLLAARRRMVFDEFLFFILALQQLKEDFGECKNPYPMQAVWKTEEVLEGLPYRLTKAQLRVWNEMENDLKSDRRMSRLVQGDVGSGKTILAFLSMIMAAENGFQSALMVPTEVLARQHFEALQELLEQFGLKGYAPLLLTGSCTKKEKQKIYERIAEGKTEMVIGTHALIQEPVQFPRLALVITDEQHRFGVMQRTVLSEKGGLPHVLVMSATPIPRTLAIILYGDLNISVLDELPAKRKPIRSCVVGVSYRNTAYRFMEREIRAGRQVYIICPMVEESENLDVENVVDYTKKLHCIFPEDIQIAMLHGQMKNKEKNEIMERFAANEIQILVSTTVVEVGVNVPNATVMMVENAERFGLAQLHQLRGRVGRGSHQSYCIFMQGKANQETDRRLEILNKSNDGFYIAAEDLKLRGPGDLFGIRQSGLAEFKLADIYQDAAILQEAARAGKELLELDKNLELEQNQGLRRRLEAYRRLQSEEPGL